MGECLLQLEAVTAGYEGLLAGWSRPVVRGITLAVRPGELVALLGPNGSGKSCVLYTASGLLPVDAGRIRFGDEEVTHESAAKRARRGMILVPEGRRLFSGMSVRENLRLAATSVGRSETEGLRVVLELFPDLERLLDRPAGTLSGGEQQMCAIGRGLMAAPRLLMIDELSLGLAPIVVGRLLEALQRIPRQLGTGVLFVEQAADRAMAIADRVIVLSQGSVVFEGSAAAARTDVDTIERAYLGLGTEASIDRVNEVPGNGSARLS